MARTRKGTQRWRHGEGTRHGHGTDIGGGHSRSQGWDAAWPRLHTPPVGLRGHPARWRTPTMPWGHPARPLMSLLSPRPPPNSLPVPAGPGALRVERGEERQVHRPHDPRVLERRPHRQDQRPRPLQDDQVSAGDTLGTGTHRGWGQTGDGDEDTLGTGTYGGRGQAGNGDGDKPGTGMGTHWGQGHTGDGDTLGRGSQGWGVIGRMRSCWGQGPIRDRVTLGRGSHRGQGHTRDGMGSHWGQGHIENGVTLGTGSCEGWSPTKDGVTSGMRSHRGQGHTRDKVTARMRSHRGQGHIGAKVPSGTGRRQDWDTGDRVGTTLGLMPPQAGGGHTWQAVAGDPGPSATPCPSRGGGTRGDGG